MFYRYRIEKAKSVDYDRVASVTVYKAGHNAVSSNQSALS